MYDLFLVSDPSKLSVDISHLSTMDLEDGISLSFTGIREEDFPGYLSLDLTADNVSEVHDKIVDSLGGKWVILSSYYRQAKISKQVAQHIAENYFAEEIEANKPPLELEAIRFFDSTPMYWSFVKSFKAAGQELPCPGMISVNVDKIDGHIWTMKELSSVFGEKYYIEAKIAYEPENILSILSKVLDFQSGLDHEENQKRCIKGRGLLIGAEKHSFPFFARSEFGIEPNIHMWLRINPPNNEKAYSLLLKAIDILSGFSESFVLIADHGKSLVIIKKISGVLTLNQDYECWTKANLEQLTNPYRLGSLT